MNEPARALLESFSALGAIDATCHLGQWPFRLGAAATGASLTQRARRHGLSSVWVSSLAALFGFDTRTGNEACLAAADGRVLRPFAVLNPGEHGWDDELAWVCGAGFAGVRIAPGIHGYPAPQAAELLAACTQAALPVQVLVRLDDARVRHPRWHAGDPGVPDIAELLMTRETGPILLSGLNWDQWDELRRHFGGQVPPGVLLDLWHMNGPNHVADALAQEPARWVFGSGFPVQAPEPTMLQLAASTLSATVLDAITRRNAETFLTCRP